MMTSILLFEISTLLLLLLLQHSAQAASIEAPPPPRDLQQEARCTACPDGSPVANPTAKLNVPGFGVQSCSVISALVGTLYPLEDPNCKLLHSVSTVCGCPSQATNPCQLCGAGNRVPDSKLELPLSYLDESVNYEGVNCELLEIYFNSSIESDDLTCQLSQAWTNEYCCSSDAWVPPSDPCTICVQNPNATIDLGEALTCDQVQEAAATLWEASDPSCAQVQSVSGPICGCNQDSGTGGEDVAMCTLCKDGSNVTSPDKLVPFMADRFFGIEPTCQQLQDATALLALDSIDCNDAQMIGSYCGCPAVENACVFCPKPGDAITTPTRKHSNTLKRYGRDLTCEQVEAVLLQFTQDTDECFLGQEHNWECGCNDGFYGYLGTESESDRMSLNWAARISGILSMLGSVFIFQDFLRGKDKKNLYRQIMFLMSMFDFTTAMGWTIGSASVPTTDLNGYDSNVWGAAGNDGLCTAQGFFVMLGYGSGFFNNSLSIYYVLVVVYGWKDYQLRKVRPFLLIVPIICAMILAFGGISFYESVWVGCWMLPQPYTDGWQAYGFSYIPVLLTTIVSTSCQIRVYWSVRSTVRKAQQWSMDHRLKQRSDKDKFTFNAPTAGQQKPPEQEQPKKKEFRWNCFKNSPLMQDNAEAAVFWQSAFYLFSYYLCWPILLVGVTKADSQDFAFWITLSFLGPLQGFFNCLVYTRPRMAKWYRARKLEKEKKRKLLEKQKAHKSTQRVGMGTSTNATETARSGTSMSYRFESSEGQALSTAPNKEAPVPVRSEGEGTPADADESRKSGESNGVPEGSAWDIAMNEQPGSEEPESYEKKFDCLA